MKNGVLIVIEDDIWIGADSTILKGVRIERRGMVSSGSVVTRDVPPYVVVVGVPAKMIKKRALDCLDKNERLNEETYLFPCFLFSTLADSVPIRLLGYYVSVSGLLVHSHYQH